MQLYIHICSFWFYDQNDWRSLNAVTIEKRFSLHQNIGIKRMKSHKNKKV